MEYLTSKEARVEKAWAKRGIAGLRSELLGKVKDYYREDWDEATFVKYVTWLVFQQLPAREWDNAVRYIEETCGMVGISFGPNFVSLTAEIRNDEEQLREEIGDDD